MKSVARLALIAAIMVFTSGAPAMAARAFMRADGVQGPVNREGQPGWFKADNFNWGSPAKPAPGGQPPRSGAGAFSFTKSMDSASTDLMQHCVQDRPIPKIVLHWYRTPGGRNFQEFTVFQVRLTECPETEGQGLERYMMDYSNIKWEFTGRGKENKPDK